MIRLFAGLALPETERQRLAAVQNGVKDARWVAPENLHLTLRFIGDVDEDIAEEACQALDGLSAQPFQLKLKELGTFGRPPSSLWIGVEDEPKGALVQFQTTMESALVRAGLDPEGRKYTPHVTLARLKKKINRDRLAQYMEAHAGLESSSFEVTGFTLFRSHLSHTGAHYEPYAEFDF